MSSFSSFILSFVISNVLSEEIWEYNLGPVTYDEAFANCEAKGYTLATIITDDDRENAKNEIGSNEAPWVGLHSIDDIGQWVFFDEEECPNTPSLACVEFWRYVKGKIHQPRCMESGHGEGGYSCTRYYGDDGYDNDIPCDQLKPYLCTHKPSECGTHATYTGEYVFIWWSISLTQAQAQAQCQLDYGSDLATILTQTDMDNAQQVISDNGGLAAWIGLNDIEEEGVFKWTDGSCCAESTDLCTSFWEPGEPDNDFKDRVTNGDCVYLHPYYSLNMYDQACDYVDSAGAHAILCNKPAIESGKVINNLYINDGTDGTQINHYTLFNGVVGTLFILTILLIIYNCHLLRNKNKNSEDISYPSYRYGSKV
eukprot:281801_1